LNVQAFCTFDERRIGRDRHQYGLITAFIALAIMVGAGKVGNSRNNQFGRISTKLNGTAN